MGYLSSDYDWDIFMSYAHVDNMVPAGDHGWVTRLRKCLETKLAQKLGRRDAYALWMDHELRGGQPITPNILEKVQRSAILLVILSPGYLASEWCSRELETFTRYMAQGEPRSVFVLERDLLLETDLPRTLADFKRSRFWAPDPRTGTPRVLGDPEPNVDYYTAVDDLVQELVDELRQRKRVDLRPASTPNPEAGTVFLAEVTDDLEEQRNNLRRYLDQAGIGVLPKGPCSLHPDAFRQAVGEGLKSSDLFVQLLSAIPGKRPPDLPEGYAKCQLQLALSMGKPILQWHSPNVDPTSVQDPIQHALLDGPTVQAEGIEDFKREIRRRLDNQLKPPPKQAAVDPFVFVNMESTDRDLADQLCDILKRSGAGYMLPSEECDPRKFRKDLKERLFQCNALILVYGATTRSWVDGYLRELQKLLTLRPPLRGLALVEGPPNAKDRLSIMLPKMKVIDCRGGVDESAVKSFLASLGSGAA